jgi:hypothetical protein
MNFSHSLTGPRSEEEGGREEIDCLRAFLIFAGVMISISVTSDLFLFYKDAEASSYIMNDSTSNSPY